MKKMILCLAGCVFVFLATAQVNLPFSKKKTTSSGQSNPPLADSSTGDPKGVDPTNPDPADFRAQIFGLGNISASQSGEAISPSASIFATLIPFKSSNLKLSLGYNLGVNTDSGDIQDVKLGTIIFPDKSKSGFVGRLSYDFFPLLYKKFTKNEYDPSPDSKGYIIEDRIEPHIEYTYSKFNFKESHPDSSNIQTSTFLYGISWTHAFTKNDNQIAIILTPYYKRVKLTDGTYEIYKKVFEPSVDPTKNPQRVNFIGLNTSLQINRFLFSFIIENLKTKELEKTPLYGGVFTVKATVTGDFIKL